MFHNKSLALSARFFFVLILLFQSVSPALAAGKNKNGPTPTFTPITQPSNTPGANACSFYPIAVSAQSLQRLSVGDTINDIYNGSQPGDVVSPERNPAGTTPAGQPGNPSTSSPSGDFAGQAFGWLSWTGDQSALALATSLTPPGNSSTYVNPNNLFDHALSIDDWVGGQAGVSNSSAVRQALDTLKTIDIDLPVWDTSSSLSEKSKR